MSTNLLQELEAQLKQNGMKNVKFLFKRESRAVPLSDLEDDLIDILFKFRKGHYKIIANLPSEELTA